LNIGDNAIAITARDLQANQATQNLTIIRNPLSSPTPAPTPVNPTPVTPVTPPPATPAPGPDTTPPSLTILSPANTNVSTPGSSLIVQGVAQDNVGVASVTWSSSNGQSGTASGTNNWITPAIPLYVGATTITIRASDAAGNTSWRSISVTRN
jgi:Big-like domain-containing protein